MSQRLIESLIYAKLCASQVATFDSEQYSDQDCKLKCISHELVRR